MPMRTKINTPNGTELGERSQALKLKACAITTHAEMKKQAPLMLLEALRLIEEYEEAFRYIQACISESPDIDYSAELGFHLYARSTHGKTPINQFKKENSRVFSALWREDFKSNCCRGCLFTGACACHCQRPTNIGLCIT